jgi:transposase
VILAIAEGLSKQAVAERLGTRPATVSKWRSRFAQEGFSGLRDASRSGKPRQYQGEHERRILAALDEPPPAGYGRWDGSLLARHLGDISRHQIWRVLRRHEISLARRRSWCISTDPAFVQKAADIVGLYLQPPENAVVFSVDEKPHIQALERAQGWLKLPNGKAVTGFSHAYKRHGTTTLFAALDVATGLVKTGHYQRRRRVEFLDFMNRLVAEHTGREIHVIWTILIPTSPNTTAGWRGTRTSISILRRPMPPGSIKWRYVLYSLRQSLGRREFHLATPGSRSDRCLHQGL